MVAFEAMLSGDVWHVVAITDRSEMGLYDVPNAYVHVFVWLWNLYDVC